jgi:ABC-type glycerol-3-phosphate transport system permease component
MGRKRKIVVGDIVIWLFLAFSVIMCLIPLINTLAVSFSDSTSAGGGKVLMWPVVYSEPWYHFNLGAYKELFKDSKFITALWIAVQRTVIGVGFNVLLCILSAYPLSKPPAKFRRKNFYMWFFVFLMLFNGGLVPTYVVVSRLGFINSIWALILPGALPIFSCIILMNFYKTIPHSLEEAALIDGAGPWRILTQIYIPLSKASIAVVALLSLVGHWNDFFGGLVYMSQTKYYPLQTYIYTLTTSVDAQRLASMTPKQIQDMFAAMGLPFSSAKVVISTIPIMIIYPFLQRYFVTGLVMGAVKE